VSTGDFNWNSNTTWTTTNWIYHPYYGWPQPYTGDPILGGWETICTPFVCQEKPKEGLMKIFDVLVVDKKECKVLTEQKNIVAKDRETAMLDLDLTPEIREKVKSGLVEFIFNEKGQFTKIERKVKIEELKEE
jgi:hypothetical protein